MDKPIRKAAKCYLVQDNKVVVTQYKKGNKKQGFYDIPGGKMEENETLEQAAIREMKEETGILVRNLKQKGKMTIEYPDRIFSFIVFLAKEYEGEPQEFVENTAEWMEIDSLLKQEKILSNSMILDRFFRKGLLDENFGFTMHILVDEQENILGMNFNLEGKNE